jgi:alkanesulfonate monooxygenase
VAIEFIGSVAPTGPTPTGPTPTDPAPTDPAPTDPAPTGPAPTGPATTGQASTGQATTAPAPCRPAPIAPAPVTVTADAEYPLQIAPLLEDAGFDRLLIGPSPSAPDGLLVANEVLTTTSRLGVLVTQIPGLVAPTVAARQCATLAAFHPGRVGLHATTADPQRDGDLSAPTDRAAQAAEFLEVVRLAWRSQQAFDFSGEFYRVTGAHSDARPADGDLPIYFSGESPADAEVGAAHADVCLLTAGPTRKVAEQIVGIAAAAARYGRSPRFGVSLRLLAAPTRQAARDRLRSAGTQTSLDDAAPVWVPPAASQLRLVGSYDVVAHHLLGYLDIGVRTLVIGHDPHTEAADCAEVIARVRAAAGRPVSAGARRPGRGSACRPSAEACLRPG